eukprot:gb/GFBE01077618.1/.p1 GENE.gb/GFBE01077618.1/~~gb/GFBE01077618.1/.p1  ORF type:complete len:622 (+),score=131.18 gb/GFBE01077618.1/:1-1866(+)
MALPRAAPVRDEDVPQGEARPSRTWQFSKTKMCKFNLIGMCMKGEQCPFAHEKTELRTLPDLTCTKLCKTLIQTGACNDASCTYAHSKEELRATSTFHKTKLCRFSQIGHCALGSKCNFAHSSQEIRPLDDSLVRPDLRGPQQEQQQLPREQQGFQQQGQPMHPQQHLLLQLNEQQRQQLQQQQQHLQQQQQQLLQQQQQNQMVAMALQQQMALSSREGLTMPALFESITGDQLQQLQYLTAVPLVSAAPTMPVPRPSLAPCPAVSSGCSTSAELPNGRPVSKEASKRRGGRRGKGSQRSGAHDGAPAQEEPPVMSGGFDQTAEGVGSVASMAGPASTVGAISGLGSLGNMSDSPSLELEWMRQNAAPCIPGPLSAAAAAYGGQGTGSYAGAPPAMSQTPPKMSQTPPPRPALSSRLAGLDKFRDAPAYVTMMESDAIKSTFLENELGPIRAPIRPIRSAAGRLDLLGGEDSGDELRDLEASDIQGLYGLSSSAGLVSFAPPVFGGAGARTSGSCSEEVAAGLSSQFRGGERAASSGATSVGSSQVGLASHSSNGGLSGANDGSWDSPLFQQGNFSMDQKEDVWQVKNTFLTLTPQVKPIRSVRTAEGALCTLGSLLDDEP